MAANGHDRPATPSDAGPRNTYSHGTSSYAQTSGYANTAEAFGDSVVTTSTLNRGSAPLHAQIPARECGRMLPSEMIADTRHPTRR